MRLKFMVAMAAVVLLAPHAARAFCGFYVSGADGELFNNATMVVMMRDGTKTVLSMQNNYQGPPQDFAMVVPVPVVLQEDDVKTLPRAVFDRVDQLAAPRLVEYWEQDPCAPRPPQKMRRKGGKRDSKKKVKPSASGLGVTVEARFEVGEYQVVILSAKDSGGLDTWLRHEGYKIPAGAAAQRGLALEPRHPDLLRAQAFALRALDAADAEATLDAYLTHRRRDDGPALRGKCSRHVAGCAVEGNPIHTHEME